MTKNTSPSSGNICTRCGKPRIFKDSWQEKMVTGQGQSVVTYSDFVCPDENCQKLVEVALAEKTQLAKERQDAQDKRASDRNELRLQTAHKNQVGAD